MKGYGWLKSNVFRSYHSPFGGESGGVLAYNYGWPSGGTTESDVSLQFLFDESSGNLTDEVASVVATANGTLTYSQSVTGTFAGLSPGIALGSSGYFSKSTTTDEVKFGTGDGTIEVTFSTTATGTQYIAASYESTYTRGWYFYVRESDGVMGVALVADDGTQSASNFNTGITDFADGEPHKLRLVVDRSGNKELFFDEVSVGSSTVSTLSGKNVPAESFAMGSLYGASKVVGLVGNFYEFRFSKNATNNSW